MSNITVKKLQATCSQVTREKFSFTYQDAERSVRLFEYMYKKVHEQAFFDKEVKLRLRFADDAQRSMKGATVDIERFRDALREAGPSLYRVAITRLETLLKTIADGARELVDIWERTRHMLNVQEIVDTCRMQFDTTYARTISESGKALRLALTIEDISGKLVNNFQAMETSAAGDLEDPGKKMQQLLKKAKQTEKRYSVAYHACEIVRNQSLRQVIARTGPKLDKFDLERAREVYNQYKIPMRSLKKAHDALIHCVLQVEANQEALKNAQLAARKKNNASIR